MRESKSKPEILLLHGALGSLHEFDSIKPLLMTVFQVHTLNFSGHGGRSFQSDFSIPTFASEVYAYIHQNNLNRPSLFGYSMGGFVALYLASLFPKDVGKIATLGTKFDWSSDSVNKETQKLNPEKIEEKIPTFAQSLKLQHQPNDWKVLLTKTAELMRDISNNKYLSHQQLLKIESYVTIGVGNEDKMVTIDESKQVSGSLNNGTFTLLDDVVHPIGKIDPHVIYQYIKKALV